MIRLQGTVTYDGGRVEEFRAGSAVFVAWESYCRRQGFPAYDESNANTMAHYCAYVALGVREGFDVWLRSVEDVEAGEAAPVDPSLTEALAD